MQETPTIRIFISSPGDVAAEREKAREVIAQLEKRYGGQLHLQPVFWEDLPLQADRSFQEGIDDAVANQAGVDALLSEKTGIDIAVFILWSRLGSPLGRQILKQDGTPYRSGTEREWDLALQARAQSGGKRPAILAYLRRDQEGFIAGQRGKDTAALEEMVRQRKLAEQFVQENFLDAETKTNVRAYHSFSQPITFAHRLRAHLKALLDERVADLMIGAARWDVTAQGSPFRGLEPFEFEHAPLFFGRDAEICDLQVRLREQAERGSAFVLLVGASGSGKSSLARAGLAPAVVQFDADGVAWRHSVLVPSDSKLADGRSLDLCVGLARALAAPQAFPELKQHDPELLDLGEGLTRDPEVAFKLRVRPCCTGRRLLLVIDQFEEIFTLGIDAAAQSAYVRALGVLARSGLVWIVATVRGDYYGHCQQLPDLMTLKGDLGQFDLLAPGAASLRQMIVEPARMAGLGFEERDGRTLDAQLLHDAEGQSEALPLLEFCLDALFERQQSRGDRWLSWADYELMRRVEEIDETTGEKRVREAESGLAGALTSEAERVLSRLDKQLQRETLRMVFGRLLDLSIGEKETPVRRIARYADLVACPNGAGPQADAQALVAAYIGRRLLVSYQDAAGERVVAVAHEALLRNWGRLQRLQAEWADHFRIRLRLEQRLAEYEADPDESRVIPEGLPGNEAVQLIMEAPELVSEELREYVVMSLAAHEKRRRRRVRWRNAITTVLVILLTIAGWQWREARIALDVADRKTREAEAAHVHSGKLAEERSKQLKIASRSAVNLARQLFAEADGADASTVAGITWCKRKTGEGLHQLARAMEFDPTAPAIREAFYLAVINRREALRRSQITLRHEDMISSAVFNADGTRIVTFPLDDSIHVWDASTGKALGEPFRYWVGTWSAIVSADGTKIMSVIDDKSVRVWDVVSGKMLGEPIRDEERVRSASFSVDGTKILTVGGENFVRVWDAASGKALGQPLRHEDGLETAEFSADGKKIVTISDGKTVRLWDVASGKPLGEPLHYDDGIGSAEFSVDGTKIVTINGGKIVRVWDAANGRALGEPLLHEDSVRGASFSADGTKILTISGESVRVWDVTSGRALGEPVRHEDGVASAEFSPDGTRIVIRRGTDAYVWDIAMGAASERALHHEDLVTSAKFCADGMRIVTASADRTARVWDAASGIAMGEALHEDAVWSAHFSPDGMNIVTVCGDKTARVWETSSRKVFGVQLRHEGSVWGAQFSPDGTKVVTASGDNSARVWEAATGQFTGVSFWHEDSVQSARFSADGMKVVTASDDKTARVWDALSGEAMGEPLRHADCVYSAEFSADGTRVVTASRDKTARVWDAASGKEIGKPLRHEEAVLSAQFSPDGTKIVTACDDKTARLWDAATGTEIGEPLRHDDRVRSADFSADGTRVVTSGYDNTARVWNGANGKAIGKPLGHLYPVMSAKFSADGTRIVTASYDKTARVWDVASGRPLGEPLCHEEAVWSAQFNADGTKIVTASEDKTARVWDATSGKPLGEPLRHEGNVLSAEFSPDGTRVVTAGNDSTARVWEAANGKAFNEISDVQASILAEALSGTRLAEDGELSPLDEGVWMHKIEHLKAMAQLHRNSPEALVAHWLTNCGPDGPIGPTNPQTRRERIEVLFLNGREGDLREAYALWPAHPLVQLALAAYEKATRSEGQTEDEFEQAVKAAQQRTAFLRDYSLKHLPADIPLLCSAAAMLDKQEDYIRVVAVVDRVLALNARHIGMLRLRAKALENLRRPDESLAAYRAVIDAGGREPDDYLNPGYYAAELERASDVDFFFSEGHKLHPKAESIARVEGWARITLRAWPAALAAFREAELLLTKNEKPSENLLAGLALSLWLNGQREDAVENYEKLVKLARAWATAQKIVDQRWAESEARLMEVLRAETLRRHPDWVSNADE